MKFDELKEKYEQLQEQKDTLKSEKEALESTASQGSTSDPTAAIVEANLKVLVDKLAVGTVIRPIFTAMGVEYPGTKTAPSAFYRWLTEEHD